MSNLTDGAWHRTHRLSPILKSWKSVGFLAVLVLTQARRLIENALEGASDNTDSPTHFVHTHPQLVIGALIGFVVLMIVVVTISTISWQRYAYLIDDENIRVRGGIFVKKDEHARLSRVQSVDVLEPLVARLFGLAILRFDVAGGRASSLDIAYLKRAEAMAMRTHILDQVRAVKDGEPARNDTGSTHESDDEYTPRRIPTRDVAGLTQAPRGASVIRALATNTRTISHDVSDALAETLAPYRVRISPDDEGRIVRVPPHNVILTQLIPRLARIGFFVLLCLVFYAVSAHYGHGKDSLSIVVPILLGSLLSLGNVIKTANAYMNFSIALTPDGLLVTRGATTTLRRVIPLDRVQALRVTQPMLWRPFGWWQIEFNMAGNSAHEEMHESVLLPVGTLDDVLVILGLVLPQPGLPDDVSPADVAIAALTGGANSTADSTAAGVFHTQPKAARFFDPLTHSRNAWCCSDTFLLIRGGFLRRWATFTPHARVQSLSLEAGPAQRARNLATVRLHSTKGPVHARLHHYDAALMSEFISKHAQLTRAARAQLDAAPLADA